MEFSQKLQQLRTARGLTQETLAEKLFVSRTAVSKWESGRGFPNIDSLKAIAAFFGVTVDELLSGEELFCVAETEVKTNKSRFTLLFCGILDCLCVLLLFLPLFRQTLPNGVQTVSLWRLNTAAPWLKITDLGLVGLTVLSGAAAISIAGLEKPEWEKCSLITGLVLTVLTLLLFVLSRQPYPGAFALCCPSRSSSASRWRA